MKKINYSFIIVIIMIVVAIFSCNRTKNDPNGVYGRGQSLRKHKIEAPSRFKKGDVVYLKPDSLKVVVLNICPCSKHSYSIYWFDKGGRKQNMDVDEELIY